MLEPGRRSGDAHRGRVCAPFPDMAWTLSLELTFYMMFLLLIALFLTGSFSLRSL